MNKNLLSLGILCLCASMTAPEHLLAQTCTTNTSGSFATASNWTCTAGYTYLTATTLNVQNAMTVSGTVTLSSVQAMNVTGGGSLTFSNNDQLIISNNIAINLGSSSNTINGPGNSSNFYISINGVPVWGKNAVGTGCLTNLSGPGRLTSSNPCTIVNVGPLPLQMTAFDVTEINKQAHISFTTVQERSVSGFTVERSSDGKSFAAVSNFIAARNTSGEQTYDWTDEQPQYGVNYYRLKVTEQDRSSFYSTTAVLNIKTGGVPVLYPNPAKEQITLNMGSSANTVVSVKDLLGRQFSCPSAGDGSVLRINITALQPGNYVIQLAGAQQTQYLRFIKN